MPAVAGSQAQDTSTPHGTSEQPGYTQLDTWVSHLIMLGMRLIAKPYDYV